MYAEAFGLADRERRIPATAATRYALASISKPLTATGVLRLVHEGQLSLDTPVDELLAPDHLRGAGGNARDATLRRVLSHTAGLPEHYQFFYADEAARPPPMTETIRRYGVVMTPPGAYFNYSNLGYGILGEVIRRTTRMSYAEFMATQVFKPLGMHETHVQGAVATGNEARRYTGAGPALPEYTFDHEAASAVIGTARDLARFGLFQLPARQLATPPWLDAGSLAMMQQPATPPGGPAYGLGWFIEQVYGIREIGHTGDMPGALTRIGIYPQEDLVVVVLSNGDAWVGEVYDDVLSILVPRIRPALEAARASASNATAPALAEQQWVGEWRGYLEGEQGPLPWRLSIEPNGHATAQLGSTPAAVVEGLGLREGWLRGRFAGSLPITDAHRAPGHVEFALALVHDHLQGELVQVSEETPRAYFAVAAYSSAERAAPPLPGE